MTGFKPWKICHCDLSEGLPRPENDPAYDTVLIVIWWRGTPLGQLEIRMSELPLPDTLLASRAAQAIAPAVAHYALKSDNDGRTNGSQDLVEFTRLALLEQPLSRLDAVCSTGGDRGASVSVVVCSRNRPSALDQCLASLGNLDPPAQEILVIDNDPSTTATAHTVSKYEGVRYLPEPRAGLSIARNSGVQNSRGEIIGFTDDDARVHPQWVDCLRGAFDDDGVMAVTGLVLPAELDTEAQWIFEKIHGGFNLGYLPRSFGTAFYAQTRDRAVPAWSIGAGANMALRREAFAKVGYFDERLGAGAAGCSEDSEFWYRLIAEGWTCRYEPRAVVFHSHRRTIAELRTQYYRYMRGHVCALFVQHRRYGDRGNLHRAFVALPRYYARLLWRLRRRRDRRRKTAFAEISGWLAGIFRYGGLLRSREKVVNSVANPDSPGDRS